MKFPNQDNYYNWSLALMASFLPSLSSLSRARNIIWDLAEWFLKTSLGDLSNEAGRDKLLIIITTSALTNVSFTLCCLLKKSDTWGVGGWGAEISSAEWVWVLLSCLELCYGWCMHKAVQKTRPSPQKYILMITLSISDVLLGKE